MPYFRISASTAIVTCYAMIFFELSDDPYDNEQGLDFDMGRRNIAVNLWSRVRDYRLASFSYKYCFYKYIGVTLLFLAHGYINLIM